MAELEIILNMVGTAAVRLKKRLDLIYGQRKDDDGRRFSGLHETVMPLCSVARSIFDQIRNTTTKKASKKRVQDGSASKFGGRPNGRITGVDMRHILLLLPYLLFDLLHDEVDEHNSHHQTDLQSPANDLIAWVLVLLEWYRLYRYHNIMLIWWIYMMCSNHTKHVVIRNNRTSTGMSMPSLLRLDALARKFVSLCASLFPFKKFGNLLFLCCEKIHSMLHCASEIMRWGSLINSSGEAAETAHKINVKGPGSNVNQGDSALGTLMTHARRKQTARLMGTAIQGNDIV